MPTQNFQWDNERILIKIRIHHSVEHISSAVFGTRGKERVQTVKCDVCDIFGMGPVDFISKKCTQCDETQRAGTRVDNKVHQYGKKNGK